MKDNAYEFSIRSVFEDHFKGKKQWECIPLMRVKFGHTYVQMPQGIVLTIAFSRRP